MATIAARTAGATVHYPADFAVNGGPGFSGPVIDPSDLTDETVGAIALLFSHELRAWVVADSQGSVFAQAASPADLADWLVEFAEATTELLDAGNDCD